MTLNDAVTPIEIVTYSAEEGTVNGRAVARGPYATIHDACIAVTVPYAQQVGGPILTHAVDTIGPPAEYWLHVHPDGRATEAHTEDPGLEPPQAARPAVTFPADSETAVPDAAVPDAAVPDTAESQTAVPDTAVPDTAVPDTAAPDGPDGAVPDAELPGAAVPDADRPNAETPDAGAPDLEVPPLRLPGFSVPAFHAPEYPTFDEPETTQHFAALDISGTDAAAWATPAPAIAANEPDDVPRPADAQPPTAGAVGEPFRSDPALLEEAWPLAPEPVTAREPVPAPRPDAFLSAQNGWGNQGPAAPTRAARRHAAGESDAQAITPAPTFDARAAPRHAPQAPLPQMPAFAAPAAPLQPAAPPLAPLQPAAPRQPSAPRQPLAPLQPAAPRQPAATRSVAAQAQIVPSAPLPPAVIPTLDDLLATRPPLPTGPAQLGWRATVRHLTGGLIALRPNGIELAQRQAIAAVQRSLAGPKTVVVINPKGGANKTTATLLIAATFGIHRGGYTLAWDNNETRGTMGWRARQGRHTNTAVDLLRELDRFADARSARVGDLDNFVRSQGNAQFDVLASDEDATSAASIDADAFNALHHSLSRFYRVMVVDTGNNMRASNWDAALHAADQVVIVSTIREDTAQSAAWVADALNEKGYRDKVSKAVTVLASPGLKPDPALTSRLLDHFGRLTRAVVQVPFDPALVAGGPIDIEGLSSASRDAWLQVTAQVADGL